MYANVQRAPPYTYIHIALVLYRSKGCDTCVCVYALILPDNACGDVVLRASVRILIKSAYLHKMHFIFNQFECTLGLAPAIEHIIIYTNTCIAHANELPLK